jgi:predicted DNA-binding antitoxin AbrB/MazE fold protein
MVVSGHVRNGLVVLDEPVSLPEGAEVQIELRERAASLAGGIAPEIARLSGILPRDLDVRDAVVARAIEKHA